MPKYSVIEKRIGETPLEAAEKWRESAGISEDIPIAYAGRLDPMAEGKLLILVGEECKKQKIYHGLDKEYVFDILFEFRSDTGDVLGLAEADELRYPLVAQDIMLASRSMRGAHTFPYPQFSSKTVGGKPLYVWMLEGRLSEIHIPTYTCELYRICCEEVRMKTGKEILEEVSAKIDLVSEVTDPSKKLGRNFRRDDIKKRWREILEPLKDDEFSIATIRATVTGGAYMRTFAEEIAKKVGTFGLAYSIKRTRIGRFRPLLGSSGIWTRKIR